MENRAYKLLADSGSTKTDWLLLAGNDRLQRIGTQGINPFMLQEEDIVDILREELLPALKGKAISEIEFYGAGCRGVHSERVMSALRKVCSAKRIAVASDMLGAARCLCGNQEGIVGILGTGSNSCLYDGKDIAMNISPLGFILGDEGSGAVLGRRLIGDVLKRQLPQPLIDDFIASYSLSADDIIQQVYREKFPNRFLASFCPFLSKHRQNLAVQNLLTDEFSRFFTRNVVHYSRPDLPIHFVGSIAYYFQKELTAAAEKHGFHIGKIKKAPLDE